MSAPARTARPARTGALVQAALLTGRQARQGMRIPVFMVMNLLQPMIWLLLFGQLFRSVIEIPGFAGGADVTYLEYLTPGVVMMTAMGGAAWAGTTFVQDMERGVMDRFLASPTSRGALLAATMAWYALLACAQALVVVGVAWLGGARFPGGWAGVAVMLVAVALLSCLFAALSGAVALLTRQQEALIGVSQLLTIPLMFLSSAVMDPSLAPDWIAGVARFNPFDWAVVVARDALQGFADPAAVWGHLALLAAAVTLMGALATSAFQAYRRSL
ncbi:ABC transporter permease [Isoptericola sp. BMS4]|uniref:ABC transporter permease n=1 Tax=Isoptericola sp. BMS4 TaxID=2527875 RepID=UPI0014234177|nr:ABC transporter permease [Isoptericola sp. BMS4]